MIPMNVMASKKKYLIKMNETVTSSIKDFKNKRNENMNTFLTTFISPPPF